MTVRPWIFGLIVAGSVPFVTASGQAPRVHDLPVTPANIHWGFYDAKVRPVLTIASGDRVNVR
jgi:hypothetical protein